MFSKNPKTASAPMWSGRVIWTFQFKTVFFHLVPHKCCQNMSVFYINDNRILLSILPHLLSWYRIFCQLPQGDTRTTLFAYVNPRIKQWLQKMDMWKLLCIFLEFLRNCWTHMLLFWLLTRPWNLLKLALFTIDVVSSCSIYVQWSLCYRCLSTFIFFAIDTHATIAMINKEGLGLC